MLAWQFGKPLLKINSVRPSGSSQKDAETGLLRSRRTMLQLYS